MSHTLETAFRIPDAGALSALDFVIKLDAQAPRDTLDRLVRDYVVTPKVAAELPAIFDRLRQAVERGVAYGHILHGGFGSGKSHLMVMLGLLLERDPSAWSKDHPAFGALREGHETWVRESNLLVVRVHMLSERRTGAGLDEVLLGAIDRALLRAGKTPVPLGDGASVLDEIREEARLYGDAFWKRANEQGLASGPEDLDAIEQAGPEAIKALAGAWLEMKGRRATMSSLRPVWGEALRTIAEHIRSQGYGGMVLLVDEFLLWLAEKAGKEFVHAINDMNTIVDFSGGRREAPIAVFFARQRNIRDFFPDLTNQNQIQQRIDHHAKRFEITELQDVELRHIVKGRVLSDPRDPDAVRAALEHTLAQDAAHIEHLLGGEGKAVLEDVFPFHPALIDVLIDVSNLMQRERSAIRLLYELLHTNRNEALGPLLPVGRVFEHIIPASGVEAAQKTETLQAIQREWYGRLQPSIAHYVSTREGTAEAVSPSRAHALEQALKTVLLGLVSPRLAGRASEKLTIDRLVALNYADADGSRARQKRSRLFTDLQQFSVMIPELQISGTGNKAIVSYALQDVSLTDVLRRAEDALGGEATKLATLAEVLTPLLPSTLQPRAQDAPIAFDGSVRRWTTTWRGTERRGGVLFGNLRQRTYADLGASDSEAFRLLIAYPWDPDGEPLAASIEKVRNRRQREGVSPAVAWVPRELTPDESRLLRQLAAASLIVREGPQGSLLKDYGQEDRNALFEQARGRVEQLRGSFAEVLKDAYNAGTAVSLLARDPTLTHDALAANIRHLVHDLLDRRYPNHPMFPSRADAAQARVVADWVVSAYQNSGHSQHVDDATAGPLQAVGVPLELVTLGQHRGMLSDTGRFADAIKRALGDRPRVEWEPIASDLQQRDGLTPPILNLLLVWVSLRGYRVLDARTGQAVEPDIGLSTTHLTLQRADLLSVPDWARARTLAQRVLGVGRPDTLRSLAAQDALHADATTQARDLRSTLTALHSELVQLGYEGARTATLKLTISALAPLVQSEVDSFQALTDWLAVWPEDDAALVTQIRNLTANREALSTLGRRAIRQLQQAPEGPLTPRIKAALDDLSDRLTAAEHSRPFTISHAQSFNHLADGLITELIAAPPPPQPPQGPPQPPEPPTPPGRRREQRRLAEPKPHEVDALLDQIRAWRSQGRIFSLHLTVELEDDA